MQTFHETGLQAEILQAVATLGYTKPTPIQAKTISHLLQTGRDLMALAQTGTGKTAAFGLPALQKTEANSKDPQVLILAPTRELALQITNDMRNFARYLNGIHIVPVYGGASIENQIKDLRKGAQIVVATPGRAKDLLQRKKLKLDKIKTLRSIFPYSTELNKPKDI